MNGTNAFGRGPMGCSSNTTSDSALAGSVAKSDVAAAVPQDVAAQLRQPIEALDDREEVVAGKFAGNAVEARMTVGNQDLRLADARGVEEDLTGFGPRNGILRAHRQIQRAERDPAGLAAPARMDDLLRKGKHALKGRAGPRRGGLPARPKGIAADRYLDRGKINLAGHVLR